MKKLNCFFIVLVLIVSLTACSTKKAVVDESVLNENWNMIIESIEGTTVNFYGWGGDHRINQWIDGYLKTKLKEEYNVNLNRVPMDIGDILNKLLSEKQQGVVNGTIDLVWINGENFYTAKNNDLLYGPFTDKLPNFNTYINADDLEVKTDFGFPTEGYEMPYGKAQFIMVYDQTRMPHAPKNHIELLELVKSNPGKFTYPAPPDFTGSAFIRNIIYDIVGHEKFIDIEPDKDTIEKVIQPAVDYLNELKPYLWNEGKSYPATLAQLDNMYADNEVLMTMTYNSYSVASRVKQGIFPINTQSFLFDKGTVGNTHFVAIPYNAPNKAGALALINAILSVEVQASKYDPNNWGDLPVLDRNKLSTEELRIFENVKISESELSEEALLERRLPEVPASVVPIIDEIWHRKVLIGE